jgi:hypothetical protein
VLTVLRIQSRSRLVSDFRIDGIAWWTPWFWTATYAALAAVYLALWRKGWLWRAKTGWPPTPQRQRGELIFQSGVRSPPRRAHHRCDKDLLSQYRSAMRTARAVLLEFFRLFLRNLTAAIPLGAALGVTRAWIEWIDGHGSMVSGRSAGLNVWW